MDHSDRTAGDSSCSMAAKQAQAQREQQELAENLARIKFKIIVMSGKGGVGKSTVAVNLAVSLAHHDKRVGLLDIDIHGPSVPKLLDLEGRAPDVDDGKMIPVSLGDHLQVMSMGFLLEHRDDAIIWRGPMKYGVIKQLIKDVRWGDLDFLVVDSPPGTGDEPLSVRQLIPDADGAVIVTTPQELALADVRKSVNFCRKLNLPVLGVVENMSGFVCPHCGEVTDIFTAGGGQSMAEQMDIPFLGRIPLDPRIAQAGDAGRPHAYEDQQTPAGQVFATTVRRLMDMAEAKDRPG